MRECVQPLSPDQDDGTECRGNLARKAKRCQRDAHAGGQRVELITLDDDPLRLPSAPLALGLTKTSYCAIQTHHGRRSAPGMPWASTRAF